MKPALKWIGRIALVVLVLAPCLYYFDSINLGQSKLWMLLSTIVWFAACGAKSLLSHSGQS